MVNCEFDISCSINGAEILAETLTPDIHGYQLTTHSRKRKKPYNPLNAVMKILFSAESTCRGNSQGICFTCVQCCLIQIK